MESIVERILLFLETKGPDMLSALIILIVGMYLASLFRRLSIQIMERSQYDKTAMGFISQTIYYVIVVIVIISALSRLGVPTNSFVAAIGAIGLAIGLALQGNLSNFASGMLILLFKPFKAGDYIAVQGVEGTVRSIQMLNTMITSKDNKTIFIPNSALTSNNVTNYTHMPTRFITMYFDINYANNHHKALEILKDIFNEEKRILNHKTLEMGIREFGENSVRLVAFPLVKTADYWAVYYHVMSEVKDRFDEAGIDIPYPQRVVYLQKGHEVEESEDLNNGLKANTSMEKGTSDKNIALPK